MQITDLSCAVSSGLPGSLDPHGSAVDGPRAGGERTVVAKIAVRCELLDRVVTHERGFKVDLGVIVDVVMQERAGRCIFRPASFDN